MSPFTLLALVGCGGPPAEIPDQTNEITAEVLPDLVTIGSVELPWLLWLTATQLGLEEWRDCPRVTARDDGGLTLIGDDCVDSTGVQWFGSATLTVDPANDREVLSLRDFGANDNVGGWKAKGQVDARVTEHGFLIDTEVALTSLANESELVLWTDVSAAYTSYDGTIYADRVDGHVGVEDWGTAELTARLVPVGLLYGCGWASPNAGRVAFESENEAEVLFGDGAVAVALPPPADTGAEDTGAGDTADTSEAVDDTGDDVPSVSDGDDTCDLCPVSSIDGAAAGACLELNRTLSWPFPSPF